MYKTLKDFFKKMLCGHRRTEFVRYLHSGPVTMENWANNTLWRCEDCGQPLIYENGVRA